MKQCPDCHEYFDDEQNYCDIDGTPLVDEATLLRAALQKVAGDARLNRQVHLSSSREAWIAVAIGVLIGVILCLVVYLGMPATIQERERPNRDEARSDKEQFAPVKSRQTVSSHTAEAAPVPTIEEAAPAENQQEPAADSAATPARASTFEAAKATSPSLNKDAISTGVRESGAQGRAVIRMKDGASIEVDAAWKDEQGIWYRRGAVVSFIDRDRVEAITEPPLSTPSPQIAEEKP
jgi:cytoskeletal protein RodZ